MPQTLERTKPSDDVATNRTKPKTLVIAIRLKPSQLGLALEGLKKNFSSGEYDSLSQIVKNTFLHGLENLTKDLTDNEISTETKQKLIKISKMIDFETL